MSLLITNLLGNMIVLTNFVIPANTSNFLQNVKPKVVARAQELAAEWGLDRSLIQTGKITQFSCVAYPEDPDILLCFGDRYCFGTIGGFLGFCDSKYNWHARTVEIPSSFTGFAKTPQEEAEKQSADDKARKEEVARDRSLAKEWRRAGDRLNMQKAEAIAEEAMKSYGLPLSILNFKEPVLREHIMWRDEWTHYFVTNSEGVWVVPRPRKHPVVFPLPCYKFKWEQSDPRRSCEIDVSGITGTITAFHVEWSLDALKSLDFLRITWPTNYLDLLGLPSNSIFVQTRAFPPHTYELYQPLGMPPVKYP